MTTTEPNLPLVKPRMTRKAPCSRRAQISVGA